MERISNRHTRMHTRTQTCTHMTRNHTAPESEPDWGRLGEAGDKCLVSNPVNLKLAHKIKMFGAHLGLALPS